MQRYGEYETAARVAHHPPAGLAPFESKGLRGWRVLIDNRDSPAYDPVVATYLEYLSAAMRHAKFERLDSGKFYASIPNFPGLWATGDTEAAAREDLYTALDDWLNVHIKVGHERPPVIDGLDLFAPLKPVAD